MVNLHRFADILYWNMTILHGKYNCQKTITTIILYLLRRPHRSGLADISTIEFFNIHRPVKPITTCLFPVQSNSK